MTFRNFRFSALVGLGIVLGAIGAVFAQAGFYQIISPTGLEQIGVDSSGSPYNNYVTVNQVRNATGYQLLASASGTIAPTNVVNSLLVNAQPTTGTTIDTPATPYDGELFQVCNATSAAWATNTVTLAAASGSSLNTGTTTVLTTLGAHTCEELQFDISDTTWFQVR